MPLRVLPTPDQLVDALTKVRRQAGTLAIEGRTKPEEVWQEGYLTAAALWQHYPGSARALSAELARRSSAALGMPLEIYERAMAAHAHTLMQNTGVWERVDDVPEGEHTEPVPEV